MRKKLPARPNLEHLRSQAKTLLQKLRAADPAALELLKKHLPQTDPTQARLADLQHALALDLGFAAWPGLARHVERLRALEGTWAFRSLEIDGQNVPAVALKHSHLLIDGDRFRTESPEATYEGIFTIDADAVPHTIDIDFIEGPEAGNRCEGLFQLTGDRVRFCLGLAGAKRPKGFSTRPGSGHALEDLERVIHGRPANVDGGTPPPPAKELPPPTDETFPDELTPTLEKLQGDWIPREIVNSGQAVQDTYLPFGNRNQTGVVTKVVFGGQTMAHARMRINEHAHPLELDYLNLEGKAKGRLSKGIFEWRDDEAVFCMAAPGDPRPTEFSSQRGDGRTYSRWKRRIF